jgi:hypothetical protein
MEQQSDWAEPVTETAQPNAPSQPAGVEAPEVPPRGRQ